MRPRLARSDGRRLFGLDAETYDRARPGHAEELYEVLRERCGLRRGAKVLEIGPGTGQATARLLELGVDPVVAVEPDSGMAEFLRERFGDRVELRASSLEDVELDSDFDLAVAASSFHWVEEDAGLARLRDALRPGGFVALWWTLFGDRSRHDPFREAVEPLTRELARSPSAGDPGRPSFALDGGARVAALGRAGFDEIVAYRFPWTIAWDTEGIRGLFGSFSPILALEPVRREALLDAIAQLADTDFGGRVERPVVTLLYIARKSV